MTAVRQEQQTSTVDARRAAMVLLSQASARELAEGLQAIGEPEYRELRPAETGLVMVRGRIGGDGAPFNLGEATVTRAAIEIEGGAVGFAYVLGRDREKARLAALADAMWQGRERSVIEQHVLAPLRARVEAERAHRRAETAATRVDFFTLVRGED